MTLRNVFRFIGLVHVNLDIAASRVQVALFYRGELERTAHAKLGFTPSRVQVTINYNAGWFFLYT